MPRKSLVHTYLPWYLPTYLPTELPWYVPTDLPCYVPTFGDLIKVFMSTFKVVLQASSFVSKCFNLLMALELPLL